MFMLEINNPAHASECHRPKELCSAQRIGLQNICLDFTSDKQKIHFYGDYLLFKQNVLKQFIE